VAYISAFRPDGFGDLDIYRIKFNDNEQINKILIGKVFLGDSIPENQPINYAISIVAKNKVNNQEYAFTPHSKTGKYVISLTAGTYKLTVKASGYKTYKEELSISDIGKIDVEKNKNFLLLKKETP
jgi:hypothetical protein